MSTIFKDSEHFYSVLYPFFEKLKSDPGIGPKIMASKLIIQFVYSDPEAVLTIDCTTETVIQGPTEITPTVTMSMKADTAHKFWLGKLSLMVAITKREIIAKGPIPSIMKLLPIIKNSYEMYKEHLKSMGMEESINV